MTSTIALAAALWLLPSAVFVVFVSTRMWLSSRRFHQELHAAVLCVSCSSVQVSA